MTPKTIIPRDRANRDVDHAVDFYLVEGGERPALGFIDALENAYRHISRHPRTGSARYAQDIEIADLRFWSLKNYPYLVFYLEREDHIDVLRVLHAERDIPVWLRDSSEV